MQTGPTPNLDQDALSTTGATPQAADSARPKRKWQGLSRREISRRLRAWRRGMWLVGVFSLLVNALMLTVPIYLLQLSDRVLVSQSYDTLYMLTVGAIGALVALSIFDWVRRLILTRIGLNLEARLGGPLLVSGVRNGVQNDQSDVQSLRDLASVRAFLTGPVVPMFFDLPTIPLYILVVFLIHPQLGFIVVFGSIALFIFALINQAVTTSQVGLSHGHASLALRQAEAQVRNADSVRSMGMLTDCLRMWGDSNREALHAFRRYNDRSAMVSSLSKLLRLLLQIAVLGWGAFLSLKGELTAGMAIAASIIASRGLAPIEGTIEGWRNFIGARNAFRRIQETLTKSNDFAERTLLPPPTGALAIDKLTYRPAGTDDILIKGISFEVPAGVSVAIIGATGAGKTTLARLLAGAVYPTNGTVQLDGADLRTWDPLQLGGYVGYLPQQVELFPGTVAQNIARMQAEPASADIVAAARFAGAHELITSFRNGYETLINIDGTPLSGGQRQRVGLARAFYGSPRLVILDEPDANLDRHGEKALLDAILRAKEAGITLIIITQRPVMLRYVDRILALAEGRIEAYSPRDALLSRINKAQRPEARTSQDAAEPVPAQAASARQEDQAAQERPGSKTNTLMSWDDWIKG